MVKVKATIWFEVQSGYEPKAISYTYRLLSNSTLIYCKVYFKV